MTTFRIRDGVGFSQLHERTIVLDVDADRYWQIDEAAGHVLRQIASGRPLTPAQCPTMLFRLGILEQLSEPHEQPTQARPLTLPALTPAASSVLETSYVRSRTSMATLAEVAVLLVAARAAVRFRSLRHNLETVANRRDRVRGKGGNDLQSVARLFDDHRRLLPFKPTCLPDTLAFLAFADRRRLSATIVFGVEAYPFAAHCWAQSGDLVLTDVLDHARMFAPILAA